MAAKKKTEPGSEQSGPSFPQPNWGESQDCMMCPFGLAFFAIRNTRPEVMEHLMKAGYELTLAIKAVVDQAAERWQPDDDDDGLQRITVH